CRFSRNSAIGASEPFAFGGTGLAGTGGGGAIFATSSTLSLNKNEFQLNTATGGVSPYSGAGGGSARGGAVSLSGGVAEISQGGFVSNSAQGGDGGRYSAGGEATGGAVNGGGELNIVDCHFSSNLVAGGSSYVAGRGLGGAIAAWGGLSIVGCAIDSNQARGGNGLQVSTFTYPGTNGSG